MVLVPLNFVHSRHLKNTPAHDAAADEIARVPLPRQDRDHPIDRTAMDSMNGTRLIRREASWNRCMRVTNMILLVRVESTRHHDQVRTTNPRTALIAITARHTLFENASHVRL